MSDGRRFAVLGAKGMLGRALAEELARRGETPVACDVDDFDIADAAAVERFFERERPDVVLNAAAYTNVDGAETDVDACERVNALAPGLLAGAAARRGALLVHVSTDFVFDGSKGEPYTEDDEPAPLSVYGRTKLAGEEAVRTVYRDAPEARHLIIRTAWLFAPWGRNFVLKIIGIAERRGEEGGELRVVDDQTGSPTYAIDLARAVVGLAISGLSGEAEGTFNLVNSGRATWYALAREAVRLAGLDVEVRPIPSSEYPTPARRPACSVLSTAKLEVKLGRPLRPWADALAECISRAFP